MPKEETVRVCVRCRPLNSTETKDGRDRIVVMDPKHGTCTLVAPGGERNAGEPPKNFTFDQVYDESFSQEEIYNQTAARIVDSVLEGFNGTVFAYGQTGTGKTFTMEGKNDPPELRGIIPRAFQQIFDAIATRGGANVEHLVRASYLEIYNEEIRDLLSKQTQNKLELKENPDTGVYVRDLTSYVVKSTREWTSCATWRAQPARRRDGDGQGLVALHSIYTITVESCETRATARRASGWASSTSSTSRARAAVEDAGVATVQGGDEDQSVARAGQLHLRARRRQEPHIPYRDSKLTRLLQDCSAATRRR